MVCNIVASNLNKYTYIHLLESNFLRIWWNKEGDSTQIKIALISQHGRNKLKNLGEI